MRGRSSRWGGALLQAVYRVVFHGCFLKTFDVDINACNACMDIDGLDFFMASMFRCFDEAQTMCRP